MANSKPPLTFEEWWDEWRNVYSRADDNVNAVAAQRQIASNAFAAGAASRTGRVKGWLDEVWLHDFPGLVKLCHELIAGLEQTERLGKALEAAVCGECGHRYRYQTLTPVPGLVQNCKGAFHVALAELEGSKAP